MLTSRTLTTEEIEALHKTYYVYPYGTNESAPVSLVNVDTLKLTFINAPELEIVIDFKKNSKDKNRIILRLFENDKPLLGAIPENYDSHWKDGDPNPQNGLHGVICSLLGVYRINQKIKGFNEELQKLASEINAQTLFVNI